MLVNVDDEKSMISLCTKILNLESSSRANILEQLMLNLLPMQLMKHKQSKTISP